MSTRTTRQRSKPVILDLCKTDFGYEVIDSDKYTNPIPIPKPAVPRPERSLNYSKTTLNPKSTDKELSSPSTSAQLSDGMSRSRTMTRPPMPNISKMPIQNSMTMQERNPVGRTGDFAIKEEIHPFNSVSMGSSRLGSMMKNPLDLNLSSQLDRPLTYNRAPNALEGSYPKSGAERTQKKFAAIIPSGARWFEMDKIHQVEKDYMREYFVGRATKTPETYKRYRNFMINLYRENPATYLNSTACRKHLAGDACSIMRLHSFLEHWGLINFHIDPAGYPRNLFLNKSNCAAEKLAEFSNKDLRMDIIEQAILNNLPSTEIDTLVRQIKTMNKNSGPVCDFCGMSCGPVWYLQRSYSQNLPSNPEQDNNLKKYSNERRMILCINCYDKGNAPNVLTVANFDKVDLLEHLDSAKRSNSIGSWTQEDTYKLLDLIQKHGDNWSEIQKNFPYKTKEDLVTCYLQMPIEKVSSINIVEMGEYRGHEDTLDDRAADQIPTVFGDYSNPILQHVAVFRSLLTKNREQKRLKKKALLGQTVETKVEERSDLEIVKISDQAKEEETTEVAKEKGEELVQLEVKTKKEGDMEEEKEEDNEKRTSQNLAHRLVEMQILKMGVKVDYLDEYEKILVHERKQQNVLHQGFVAERVDAAHKRLEILKKHTPVPTAHYHDHAAPIDTGYFDFGDSGANFGADDMLDLGEGFH